MSNYQSDDSRVTTRDHIPGGALPVKDISPAPPQQMPSEEEIAQAWLFEWENWCFRRRLDKNGYQAVRSDIDKPLDANNQEIFELASHPAQAEIQFNLMREKACARAVLALFPRPSAPSGETRNETFEDDLFEAEEALLESVDYLKENLDAGREIHESKWLDGLMQVHGFISGLGAPRVAITPVEAPSDIALSPAPTAGGEAVEKMREALRAALLDLEESEPVSPATLAKVRAALASPPSPAPEGLRPKIINACDRGLEGGPVAAFGALTRILEILDVLPPASEQKD